jgi:hypothetical protein
MWELIELFKKSSYSSEIKSNKPSFLKTPHTKPIFKKSKKTLHVAN